MKKAIDGQHCMSGTRIHPVVTARATWVISPWYKDLDGRGGSFTRDSPTSKVFTYGSASRPSHASVINEELVQRKAQVAVPFVPSSQACASTGARKALDRSSWLWGSPRCR